MSGVLVPGREIEFYVRRKSRSWILTRAERSEDEQEIMRTDTLTHIELMLTFLVGEDLRAAARLPLLAGPLEPEDVHPPAKVIPAPSGGYVLSVAPTAIFRKARGLFSASAFSALIDHTPDQIRQAYLHPTGAPLFTPLR